MQNILRLTVDVEISERVREDIFVEAADIIVEGGTEFNFLEGIKEKARALVPACGWVSKLRVCDVDVCGLDGRWHNLHPCFYNGGWLLPISERDDSTWGYEFPLDELDVWFADWCVLTQEQQAYSLAYSLTQRHLSFYSDVESERIPDALLDQLPPQYIEWVALPDGGEQFPIYSDWYWLDHAPADSVAARYLRSKLFPAGVVNG